MRRTLAIILAAATAVSAGAQGTGDLSVITGPQFTSYTIGSSTTAKTVAQLSLPFAVIVPLTERFSLDVSTNWAQSTVSSSGTASSRISGLTDTQLRINWSLGERTVLTLGANVPRRMYKAPDKQQEAAGQVASPFLLYPVSSMGSGLGTTAGLAQAMSFGEWNVGLGASVRVSSPFDAYQVQTRVLRFEPGSEARVRVGVDRAFGDVRFTAGATYSMFTDDKADSTTFATGGRALGQAALAIPTSSGEWTLSAWDLYRGQGQQSGGSAPWENIVNGNLTYGFDWNGVFVQPSLEGRAWMRDYEKAGMLGTASVRFRFRFGLFDNLSVNPTVSYSLGNVYASTTPLDVQGFRALLLLRWR